MKYLVPSAASLLLAFNFYTTYGYWGLLGSIILLTCFSGVIYFFDKHKKLANNLTLIILFLTGIIVVSSYVKKSFEEQKRLNHELSDRIIHDSLTMEADKFSELFNQLNLDFIKQGEIYSKEITSTHSKYNYIIDSLNRNSYDSLISKKNIINQINKERETEIFNLQKDNNIKINDYRKLINNLKTDHADTIIQLRLNVRIAEIESLLKTDSIDVLNSKLMVLRKNLVTHVNSTKSKDEIIDSLVTYNEKLKAENTDYKKRTSIQLNLQSIKEENLAIKEMNQEKKLRHYFNVKKCLVEILNYGELDKGAIQYRLDRILIEMDKLDSDNLKNTSYRLDSKKS